MKHRAKRPSIGDRFRLYKVFATNRWRYFTKPKIKGLFRAKDRCQLCGWFKPKCYTCTQAKKGNVWTDDFGTTVIVHDRTKCLGTYCTIHNHSNHVMKDFSQKWRTDKRYMERVCPHGIGHPDPDEVYDNRNGIHGCDGCCR
jgi:hypothetical protein